MKRIVGIAAAVLLASSAALGRQASGSGAPPMSATDPTPFEQFVAKLKLDDKKQLPEVQKIFMAAAGEAAPISQEMVKLQAQLVALDGKPGELAPVLAAHTAAATKMAAIELRAFLEVQALLTPGQQSKSAEAFAIMAGLFHPPAPRAGGATRRGRGVQ